MKQERKPVPRVVGENTPQSEDTLKLKELRSIAKEAFDSIDRGEFVTLDCDKVDEFLGEIIARKNDRRWR